MWWHSCTRLDHHITGLNHNLVRLHIHLAQLLTEFPIVIQSAVLLTTIIVLAHRNPSTAPPLLWLGITADPFWPATSTVYFVRR